LIVAIHDRREKGEKEGDDFVVVHLHLSQTTKKGKEGGKKKKGGRG